RAGHAQHGNSAAQDLGGDARPEVRRRRRRLRQDVRRVPGQLRRRGSGRKRLPRRRARPRLSAGADRHPARHSARARPPPGSAADGPLMFTGLAFLLMLAGYAGGALAALLARSGRDARLATARGAALGSAGALLVAALVLSSGRPLEIPLPGLIAVA